MTVLDQDLSARPARRLDFTERALRATPVVLLMLAAVLALMIATGRLLVHTPNTALLAAQPFAIKLHLITVLSAFAIGVVLMIGVKGATLPRSLGWAWVVLMTTTAIVSFFIHGLNRSGFSPIHALSAWVVVAAPFGLYLAKRHQVAAHRRMMTGLFLFGLLVAGAFTFVPGRLMFEMFFSLPH